MVVDEMRKIFYFFEEKRELTKNKNKKKTKTTKTME